ncbi:nonstructural protein [Microviridae sp.]|nr:nonstructural protein [Microviridae sp.]
MKYVIGAVRDSKADVFNRPIFMQSVGVMIRSFQDEVNRAADDNQMFKHPGDFAIYELGSYDDVTAVMEMHEQPKLLVQADQCINK